MENDCFNRLIAAKKIMIFGIPGSGKSTFALKLSRLLHIPLFHLDKYFFTSNWQERNYQEFLNIQKELVDKEAWIIDGNSSKSFEMRFSQADVVLYFRFNRLLCLWRIFKRLLFKDPHISDRAEGCSENVRLRLIQYLWGFNDRVELPMQELRQKYPQVQFYEIHSDKELASLIENLRKAKEEKYSYKPYSSLFPDLFVKEKERILSQIPEILSIEHIGSTAVPGLGGKGIIDIGIATNRNAMDRTCKLLQKLGYEFRPSFSTPDRLYLIIYLPDPEEGKRRYHIHLTHLGNREWDEFIGFRDYLRNHPEEVQIYSDLKKKAAQAAKQDGKVYRTLKDPFFERIGQFRSNPTGKMHADELEIDLPLVQRLLKEQFPAWSSLPLKPVPSAGTDNALYRLGEDKVVRLPRIGWAVENVGKEFKWLPQLAPFLPVSIPTPLGLGKPTKDYPWPWSIYSWLKGTNPVVGQISPLLTQDLIAFIRALQKVPLSNGLASNRGVPLKKQNSETRKALEQLEGMIDTPLVTTLWEGALKAPPWSGPPVWVHGDLSPGNLLIQEGRLSAVIDFGSLGTGDPACDLIIAWNLLPADQRYAFRLGLGVDDATWQRGRGWALSNALIALPYYKNTNPALANNARHVIIEILDESK